MSSETKRWVIGLALVNALIFSVILIIMTLSSKLQREVDTTVLRVNEVTLDELPKGTTKVTYLGRGWFTFEMRIDGVGMTRKFLGVKYLTHYLYANISFTELKD